MTTHWMAIICYHWGISMMRLKLFRVSKRFPRPFLPLNDGHTEECVLLLKSIMLSINAYILREMKDISKGYDFQISIALIKGFPYKVHYAVFHIMMLWISKNLLIWCLHARNDSPISLQSTHGWDEIQTWWRHQMETFFAHLALCAGNSPVIGELPSQRPVTRSFDVYFDLPLA